MFFFLTFKMFKVFAIIKQNENLIIYQANYHDYIDQSFPPPQQI